MFRYGFLPKDDLLLRVWLITWRIRGFHWRSQWRSHVHWFLTCLILCPTPPPISLKITAGSYLSSFWVFPVVMHGCESWTVKKAECWGTDAFELWYRRRLVRVLWTARRSNQSILEEINPEYLWEGLMLKRKFQYFANLMWRTNLMEKTLIKGQTEGKRRKRGRRSDC